MLNARVRIGASWNDVCILDISTRGLMIQATEPPARGAYLDVFRGHQSIVARVVWVDGQRFGLRSQDALPVEDIICPPDASTAALRRAVAEGAALERRVSPRATLARHEASRTLSRSIEFGFVVLLGAALGITAFSTVAQALGSPLEQVSASLSPS